MRTVYEGLSLANALGEQARFFAGWAGGGAQGTAAAQTAADPALNGALYVLDMGRPVSIMRLARQLLRLRGRDPDAPGAIRVVGLRPGEKRHESLVYDFESTIETSIDGVWAVTGPDLDPVAVSAGLDAIVKAAGSNNSARASAALEALCKLRPSPLDD